MNFSKIENVKEWLKDLLSRGPILASEILGEAKELNISTESANSTLYRAKDQLKIKSQKSPNGDWWWYDPLASMDEEKLDKWYSKNHHWLKNYLNDLESSDDYIEFREILDKDDQSIDYNDNPYEWLEQQKIYYTDEVKKETREKEREAVLHRKEFKNQYGYDSFPAHNYGIKSDN